MRGNIWRRSLIRCFPTGRPDLDPLFARHLIYLEAPSAAAKVVAALEAAPTQEEQIDLAVALRSLKSGWTTPLREQYFRWFAKAESYRGGNTFASSLRREKNDAIATLNDEDKAALKDVLEAPTQRVSTRKLIARVRLSRSGRSMSLSLLSKAD